MLGDLYIDPWEKASSEAFDLAMELMRYGHWLRHQQSALEMIGVRPPELRAVATMVCAHQKEVEAVAAVMEVDTASTGDTLISATTNFVISATTNFGALSVEAYAARWAAA